jgi:hypothetical protein
MNSRDWLAAWHLIECWNDEDRRHHLLDELRASGRRPWTILAMVRIAALLSRSSKVEEGFAEQLVRVDDTNAELGILNITDQILVALDADDSPENEGVEEVLKTIPDEFAFRDILAHEADIA